MTVALVSEWKSFDNPPSKRQVYPKPLFEWCKIV